MNAHTSTPEYQDGYVGFYTQADCPHVPGTTAHALWNEGYKDARDDDENQNDACPDDGCAGCGGRLDENGSCSVCIDNTPDH